MSNQVDMVRIEKPSRLTSYPCLEVHLSGDPIIKSPRFGQEKEVHHRIFHSIALS